MKDINNMMIFPNLKTVTGDFISSVLTIGQSVVAQLQQIENKDFGILQTRLQNLNAWRK